MRRAQAWVWLAFLGWTGTAGAQPSAEQVVERRDAARAALDAGDVQRAARLAARRLYEDSYDLDAHAIYQAARAEGWAEGRALEAQYRAWFKASRADATRAVALARAVLHGHAPRWAEGELTAVPGPWCDEIDALTTPLPEEPRVQAHALEVRHAAHRACGRDAGRDLAELVQLGESDEAAYVAGIRWQVRAGEVDRTLTKDLVYMIEVEPRMLWVGADLWRLPEPVEGPVNEARRKVRKLAGDLVDHDDPSVRAAAYEVLVVEGRTDEAAAVLATLRDALSGAYRDRMSPGTWWGLRRAERTGSALRRLAILDGLLEEQTSAGPAVAVIEGHRAEALVALGRPDEAMEAALAAYEADATGDDAWTAALRFADLAASRRTRLDEALDVVGRALQGQDDAVRWPGGTEGLHEVDILSFHGERRVARGALLRVRAELLEAAERPGEAAHAWRRSLDHDDDALAHLRLGLLLTEDGPDHEGFAHLAEGLAMEGAPGRVVGLARRRLETQFADLGMWNPDGGLGYVKARRKVRAEAEEGGPGHPSVGLRFPVHTFMQLDGAPFQVSETQPVVVTYLWSTECESCGEELALLDDLATRWEDEVTVVALSVDRDRDAAVRWFEGSSKPGFVRAWDPRAAELLRAPTLPSVFVVGADRIVRDVTPGFTEDDGAAMEAAIAAAAARARAAARRAAEVSDTP